MAWMFLTMSLASDEGDHCETEPGPEIEPDLALT
jgi:hypothetical protein